MAGILKLAQFVLFISIVLSIFFGMHFLVYRTITRVFALDAGRWLWIPIVLTLSFIGAMILVRFFPNDVTRWYYIISSVWLGTVFLLFSAFVLYGLYYVLSGVDSHLLALVGIVLALLAAVYGVVHARAVIVKEVSIVSARVPRDMTIVQLSDLHVGTIHNEQYLERVVSMVNEQRPNMVLITGDLFDGSAPIDSAGLAPLSKITVPVYFSIGNHEVYEGLDKVRTAVAGTKLILLENALKTEQGIQIVGINDPADTTRLPIAAVLSSIPIDKNLFTVAMYHSPVNWDSVRGAGADLMLSGHTHNGQIIPFNLLVKIFYRRIQGLYEVGGKYLYTSPGTGTWGPPMRIGSTAEVTVFKIKRG